MSNISKFGYARLKSVMYDRLHGLSSLGPSINEYTGPEPYEWLDEVFQKGSEVLRGRMSQVLSEFIEELPDPDNWPSEALNNLFSLIKRCGYELSDDIYEIVLSNCLLQNHDNYGRDCQAGFLQCLTSLERRGTVEFWLKQCELLGAEYGALIFGGLLLHGLRTAMEYLPLLCKNKETVAWIELSIDSLVDTYGQERIAGAFEEKFPELSSFAQNEFAKALDIELSSSSITKGPRKVSLSKKEKELIRTCRSYSLTNDQLRDIEIVLRDGLNVMDPKQLAEEQVEAQQINVVAPRPLEMENKHVFDSTVEWLRLHLTDDDARIVFWIAESDGDNPPLVIIVQRILSRFEEDKHEGVLRKIECVRVPDEIFLAVDVTIWQYSNGAKRAFINAKFKGITSHLHELREQGAYQLIDKYSKWLEECQEETVLTILDRAQALANLPESTECPKSIKCRVISRRYMVEAGPDVEQINKHISK